MISEAQCERVRLHVRKWFARHIPPTMCFHDLEHTLSVTRSAKAIGQAVGLATGEMAILEVAALFHDTGYADHYRGHEERSAELAQEFLTHIGVGARDIARVRATILATRMDRTPRGLLQQVLRDADSSKAGQADFIERSEDLRRELELVGGKRIAAKAWLAENLTYLARHRFHTRYARTRYGKQKAINLAQLRRRSATPKGANKTSGPVHERFFDRDLSWLSFNERVLQEANDPRVPLLERLKFLAIFSSNLDEFYRVRVASLRSLNKLKKVSRAALEVPPEKLVERINKKALTQQRHFGTIYREKLIPALAKHGIRIIPAEKFTADQTKAIRLYFSERVAPLLHTAALRPGNAPFIEDRKLYLACRLKPKRGTKERLVLLNIPSDEIGRFVELPSERGRTDLAFLDDAMRVSLPQLFTGHKVLGCHAFKLSRDAELYLDEEFVGSVKEKVRKSLRKRSTGVPSRFLYDSDMPPSTLKALRGLLGLTKPDLVPGGRYHNFSDLMRLPVKGHPQLRERPLAHVPPLAGQGGRDVFRTLSKGDILWHFPYHDFDLVSRWLRQAGKDPTVRHIAITLYRVAEGSEVCKALLEALGNGKRITVFVEVQARFDERSNLFWGETLERAGAEVIYSYADLKVHCKLCLIERRVNGRVERSAFLGTGNFHERTAKLYTDMALLTSDNALTREVAEVFAHLRDRKHRPALNRLFMAPLSLRGRLETCIDKEIETAMSGRKAEIFLKLNSLEDRALIRKLYDASNAGVRIRIVVRGICCLVAGVPGSSANIEVISIVDRFLEHTRVYQFHNDGKPLVMLSSADWMGRNLDRRIEVAFPILDNRLQRLVLELLEIQWNDRVKARVIDQEQTNGYRTPRARLDTTRSQLATYRKLAREAR